VDNTDPPIQIENFLSVGAIILTLELLGVIDTISSYNHS
jgi:hypothetical protein